MPGWLWAATALAGLSFLLAALLCIPISLAFEIDSERSPRASFQVVWMFGLVTRRLAGGGREQQAGRRKRRGGGLRLLHLLLIEGLPGQAARLVRDALRTVRLPRLRARVRFGLDDPADTGMLFGWLYPAALGLSRAGMRELALEPEFSQAVIAGAAEGTMTITPIRLVRPVLRFLFSMPAIRAAKGLVRDR